MFDDRVGTFLEGLPLFDISKIEGINMNTIRGVKLMSKILYLFLHALISITTLKVCFTKLVPKKYIKYKGKKKVHFFHDRHAMTFTFCGN